MKIYNHAYIGGTFDILHPGHVALFRKTADVAHYVTVSLNTDEFVKQYKGRPPVMTLDERIAVIEACRYIDDVIVNTGGADSKPAIINARPDVIIHGTDWTGESLMQQMGLSAEFMQKHGIDFHYIPVLKKEGQKVSSMEIKDRIYERAEKEIRDIESEFEEDLEDY